MAGKAEKGELTWPLMMTYGAKFQSGGSELSFYKGGAGYLVLVSSHWRTIGRLEELILLLEKLIKCHFHVIGPLNKGHLRLTVNKR